MYGFTILLKPSLSVQTDQNTTHIMLKKERVYVPHCVMEILLVEKKKAADNELTQ